MTEKHETNLASITMGTDANYGAQAGANSTCEKLGAVAPTQGTVVEKQLTLSEMTENAAVVVGNTAVVAENTTTGAKDMTVVVEHKLADTNSLVSGAKNMTVVTETDGDDPFVSDEELRAKGITVRTVVESSGNTVAEASVHISNVSSQGTEVSVTGSKGLEIAPASDMTSMIEEAIRGKSVEPPVETAGTVDSFENTALNADAMMSNIHSNAPESEKAAIEDTMRKIDELLGSSDDSVYGVLSSVGKPKQKKSKLSKKDKLRQIAELVDADTYEKIKGILDEDNSVHILGATGTHWAKLSADNSAMLDAVAERFEGINKSTLLGLILYNAVNDRIEDGDMFLRTPFSLAVNNPVSTADKKAAYEVSPLMYSNLNNSKYCCGLTSESVINLLLRNFLVGLPECKFNLNYIFDYCRYTEPREKYRKLAYERHTVLPVVIPATDKTKSTLIIPDTNSKIAVTLRKNIGANNSGYCLYLEDMPVFSFVDSSMLSSICVYNKVSADINYLAIHLNSDSQQRVLYGFIHGKILYIWNPSRGWQASSLC